MFVRGLRNRLGLVAPRGAWGLHTGQSNAGSRGGASGIVTDDFPYARLSDEQFARWSSELSEEPLGLTTFFAQHRPLLLMNRDVPPAASTDVRDVPFEHVWLPHSRSLLDPGVRAIPQRLARSLGPFDVSSFVQAPPAGPRAPPPSINVGQAYRQAQPPYIKHTLSLIASILEKHNSRQDFGEGTLVHIPMSPEGEVEATSVRRKRKLKMNRHKYRKRLKVQRTLRRRLR